MHSPVFILGSPRSGTSALADVLWHIGYHGFGEGHFLSLIHYWEAIVDQHYVRFAEPPRAGVMLGNIDKGELKRRMFATFRSVVDDLDQQEPWFDKTPDPGMILASPSIKTLWPDSVFVFAKRRGIENVISRVKKFPGESFENHCAGWAGTMRVWRKVRALLPPGSFIEVEQRDMIQQPEHTAQRLCAFLQLYESTVLAVSEAMSTLRPEESAAGSASKTSSLDESGWTAEQKETFLKHCENEMNEYGYTLDERYSINP
jgi:hypothetical protein